MTASGADKLTLIKPTVIYTSRHWLWRKYMTFGVGEGQCVIDRLPGGGPAAAISGKQYL
jgi:hypothetical protein